MVSYEYFMDEMNEIEIPILAENIDYALADEWQMMRWLLWATLKTTFKIGEPQKIFPLPIDDNYKKNEAEEHITTITNDQVKKLKEISRKITEEMNGNKCSAVCGGG